MGPYFKLWGHISDYQTIFKIMGSYFRLWGHISDYGVTFQIMGSYFTLAVMFFLISDLIPTKSWKKKSYFVRYYRMFHFCVDPQIFSPKNTGFSKDATLVRTIVRNCGLTISALMRQLFLKDAAQITIWFIIL